MEMYIKQEEQLDIKVNSRSKMGKKVLLATLYNPDPILLASTRLGPERLILLVDKNPDKMQQQGIKVIEESLGRVLDVKIIKTDVYDIVEVAKKAVEIIDLQPKEDHIFVNITAGRKPQAIGLLFASYVRHDRISRIAYNPEEDKTSIVYLPKMRFIFTESQKQILEELGKNSYKNISDLAEKVKMSTAMLYRAIAELKDMDLVSTDNEIKLTDAGKIARL